MKHLVSIFLLLSVLSMSCQDTPTYTPEHPAPKVAEVIQEPAKSVVISSGSRSPDILSKLFRDQLKRDSVLAGLFATSNTLNKMEAEQLAPVNEFFRVHDQYWRDAQSLINQVEDTVLQQSMERFMRGRKDKFAALNGEVYEEIERLGALESSVADLELALKLYASANLLQQYEEEEKPSEEGLKRVNEAYELHIQELVRKMRAMR